MSPGVRNLGHEDGVGRDARRRPQIVHAPRRLDRVDADDQLAAPVAAVLHRRADVVPGGRPWPSGATESSRSRMRRRQAATWPFPARARWRPACRARCVADGRSSSAPSCAAHNSARRAEDQGFAHNLRASRRLGAAPRRSAQSRHGPRPRPLLARRLRLGRPRRHRAGAAMARARGHRHADGACCRTTRLSALCRRADRRRRRSPPCSTRWRPTAGWPTPRP